MLTTDPRFQLYNTGLETLQRLTSELHQTKPELVNDSIFDPNHRFFNKKTLKRFDFTVCGVDNENTNLEITFWDADSAKLSDVCNNDRIGLVIGVDLYSDSSPYVREQDLVLTNNNLYDIVASYEGPPVLVYGASEIVSLDLPFNATKLLYSGQAELISKIRAEMLIVELRKLTITNCLP